MAQSFEQNAPSFQVFYQEAFKLVVSIENY